MPLSLFKIDADSPSYLTNIKLNKPSGSLKHTGYFNTKIKGRMIGTHRLVYAIHNKVSLDDMEGMVVDHIDGCKINNNPSNLRLVTVRQNAQNSHRHRLGKLVGASLIKSLNKWVSQCEIKGKATVIGYFDTELEAHNHYLEFIELL